MAKARLKNKPEGASNLLRRKRNRTRRNMEKVLNKHILMRRRFTRTWSKHNRPDYEKVFKYRSGIFSIKLKSIAPEARAASISVYEMITKRRHGNLATKVRYMQVSRDFISKTQPRVIDSGQGRGKLTGLNVNRPQKGIVARETDEIVNEALAPDTKEAILQGYAP